MTARSFVLLLLAACGAAALTALAATGHLVPGEVSLARSLQDAPLGHAIEELADALASRFVEYAVVGVIALAALRLRQYTLAATALLVLGGMAVNSTIKELVQRGRPTDADVVIREHPGGFGFPSGHVQSATLVYGYAAVSARRLMSRQAAVIAVAASLVAVTAIAFNRVYNGVHWPSDVAGGALIGLLLVAAAVQLPEWVRSRHAGSAERGTTADAGFG